MRVFLFSILLATSTLSLAQDLGYPPPPPRTAIDIGHNVTATSWTMQKGQCTVGLQIIGCGINNRTSLAFSPWLVKDYEMANLALRYLISESTDGTRNAVQTGYFTTWRKRGTREVESVQMPDGRYEMQALWIMGVRTWRLKPDYHLHANVHTNYYFNEKMPFSLRRPYIKKTPFQLNISTLHEMDLVKGWVIKGELGLVDALRSPWHFHTGVTLGRRIHNWHWHMGFSMTSTYNALMTPTQRYDYQQGLRVYDVNGYDSPDKSSYSVEYDFSLHPEFSLQYYF